MDLPTKLALFAVFLFFAVPTTYFLVRGRKARLLIKLPRPYRYKGGENIDGKISLTPRNHLGVDRITIRLSCTQSMGSGKSSVTRFQSDLVIVEHVKLYAQVETQYSFRLQLPDKIHFPSLQMTPEAQALLGSVGKLLTVAIKASNKNPQNLFWKLEVFVATSGADPFGTTPLDVDMSSIQLS